MKKVLGLFIMLFALCFVTGCSKSHSVEEIRQMVNDAQKVYTDATSVHYTLDVNNGTDNTHLEVQYDYNSGKTALQDMAYVLTSDGATESMYVKEGVAYMDRFGQKFTSQINDNQVTDIIDNYGFAAFTHSLFKVLGPSFFESASVISDKSGVALVDLDLTTYNFSFDETDESLLEIIEKLTNKSSVQLEVHYESDTVKELSLNITDQENVTSKIVLTLLGTSTNTIDYPDLTGYSA